MSNARFSRHLALAEIGPRGQAAIARSVAHVSGEEIARRYAVGAGFSAVRADGPREDVPPWVLAAAARELVAGSLSALRAIRAAIVDERAGVF